MLQWEPYRVTMGNITPYMHRSIIQEEMTYSRFESIISGLLSFVSLSLLPRHRRFLKGYLGIITCFLFYIVTFIP